MIHKIILLLVLTSFSVFSQEIDSVKNTMKRPHRVFVHTGGDALGLSYTFPISDRLNPRILIQTRYGFIASIENLCNMF